MRVNTGPFHPFTVREVGRIEFVCLRGTALFDGRLPFQDVSVHSQFDFFFVLIVRMMQRVNCERIADVTVISRHGQGDK